MPLNNLRKCNPELEVLGKQNPDLDGLVTQGKSRPRIGWVRKGNYSASEKFQIFFIDTKAYSQSNVLLQRLYEKMNL